jgi:hypothetical protein
VMGSGAVAIGSGIATKEIDDWHEMPSCTQACV